MNQFWICFCANMAALCIIVVLDPALRVAQFQEWWITVYRPWIGRQWHYYRKRGKR